MVWPLPPLMVALYWSVPLGLPVGSVNVKFTICMAPSTKLMEGVPDSVMVGAAGVAAKAAGPAKAPWMPRALS